MLFEKDVHLQEIVLRVVLGHSLKSSGSHLSLLSPDIIRHALVPAIEEKYWKSRLQEGLLTPELKPVFRKSISPPKPLPQVEHRRRKVIARPKCTNISPHRDTTPVPWTFSQAFPMDRAD